MENELVNIIVDNAYHQFRIDKYLSVIEESLTRSYIQKLIDDGMVTVNQKEVKQSFKISAGDNVSFRVPELEIVTIEPENIPLNIIYEDEDIIVINKDKGMVVHPAAGHYSGTLVNALLYHCKDSLSGISGILRPGIVHRIDKDTTGVLAVCKNDISHHMISEQLKEHSINRKYNALVHGAFEYPKGRIEEPIGRCPNERKKMAVNYRNGKLAATTYQVIEKLGNKHSHIECSLETGRTHQIRVHMSYINHHLIGDTVYGRSNDEAFLKNHGYKAGQMLHARVLGFIHPRTKQYVEYEAPLPEYFTQFIEILHNI